jgi:hypothetical protein
MHRLGRPEPTEPPTIMSAMTGDRTRSARPISAVALQRADTWPEQSIWLAV